MANIEELCRLLRENQIEAAGRLARDKWPSILRIEKAQRDTLLATLSPTDQSLAWLAVL